MNKVKKYIVESLGRSTGFLLALLLILSGCVNDDSLNSDLSEQVDDDKIIMNLHLDLSSEQDENITTRAAGIEGKQIDNIFVFLFDESGNFKSVEQSIERKPGDDAGATRFFIPFDKNTIENTPRFKVVVVANLTQTLAQVKTSMKIKNTFSKFLNSYEPLQLDAQSYGKSDANLLTSTFFANKEDLTDLKASLVRPISKFKISLNSQKNYTLKQASLYGYSEKAGAVFNINELSGELVASPIEPAETISKLRYLASTSSITSLSSGSYITTEPMVAAEQLGDLIVVVKCEKVQGKPKYFASRISNDQIERNKSYTIDFIKLSGEGYDTEAEAAVGEDLSTTLKIAWDSRIREGYVRQHKYFGVGKTAVREPVNILDEFSTYVQTNIGFKSEEGLGSLKPDSKEDRGLYFSHNGIDLPITETGEGLYRADYIAMIGRVVDIKGRLIKDLYKVAFIPNMPKGEKPETFKVLMHYEGAVLMEFTVTSDK